MLSFKALVVIIAACYGFDSGIKDIKFSTNPYYNLYSFTSVLIEVTVNIFMAYYLPWGYMSYHILCHLLATKIWKKIYV
jgi:hypothetical protein